ncbi:UDP-glucuronosyltransferase 2C1-like isoform X2 [Lytechinus variegatus]|uniref:UDP-glucuronosyltransferase 2C1-like isoform X2 n=1 Tax=Lytechinus variegatus TaxID=7654 RepID=UPI001BB19292|nr:UDP-glucuronosyltransferase 2C1-like isoform X2 [Lytechinus variegatus]
MANPSFLLRRCNAVPFMRFCVVLLTLPPSLLAGNVLITTSLGEGSHYFVGKTIGKYLVRHGHNVTVLVSEAYAHRADNPEDSELNFIVFHQSTEQIKSVRERHLAFSKRVNNVVANQVLFQILEYMHGPFNTVRERHQIRQDLQGSVSDLIGTYTDLFLVNMDFAVEYPLPLIPNIITIGGITARPAAPLPDDLETLMQSSGDGGVILFTLGTYVTHIRQEFLEPFAEVFGRYPQQKVLWQFVGEPKFKIPPNVKMMPWLPQNDILGHPKTRLFIFHGGNNGFYETMYHGVPAILIPLTGDAIDQGSRLTHQGFGIVLDKTNVTVDVLDDAIKTIFNNNSYSEVAKLLSARLQSRSMHPGDRAAFWVNHVMKHGGGYMRSPLIGLNFIQRNMLDVLAFFLALVSVILVVSFYSIRCTLSFCKQKCISSSKQKHD